MKTWLRGKPGGIAAFLLIAGLVTGGLGWATAAALGLESEQRQQRAEAERANQVLIALWRLDSYVAPIIAREDSRPFDDYGAIHPSPLLGNSTGANTYNWSNGAAFELSPLLTTRFEDWEPLHFQVDAQAWKSPQVLDAETKKHLEKVEARTALANLTTRRCELLNELSAAVPPAAILASACAHARPIESRDATLYLTQRRQNAQDKNNDVLPNQMPAQQVLGNSAYPPPNGNVLMQKEFETRAQVTEQLTQLNSANTTRRSRPVAINTLEGNNLKLLDLASNVVPGTEVTVTTTALGPVWLTGRDDKERLFALRLVRMEDREVCQGVLLDLDRLRDVLTDKVKDLFPEAKLLPVRDAEETPLGLTMTSLPLQLDPGPLVLPSEPGWTPLRVGLTLAWTAALIALVAVAVGGWSLINLSERRIRFVSAVTHELRTPLTTLRLYLDMLLNGLVRDSATQREYLETLDGEANRLTRLVGNVLDFSRLENQRPRLQRAPIAAAALLERLRETWEPCCQRAEKKLVVEPPADKEMELNTDAALVQQIIGNLIDNACKYSKGAEDRRIWLRVRREADRIVLEVEDRGPGIPGKEQRSIFRPFRRGQSADVTAGGVGLGLALARRWATLLGGCLVLDSAPPGQSGARFQLSLPA